MSTLKRKANLHLGVEELNKWDDFLSKEGYKKLSKQYIGSYGVVNHPSDTSFDNLKVVQGTAINKLTVKSGIAINGDVDHIINPTNAIDVLTTPTDGIPRYVIIEYASTSEEVGTINIATNGTITGTGTLFTKVLRGQPYHSTKIQFLNSSFNLQEYEVLDVTSDTLALIQGASFTAESNLKYKVVGTFTPGIVISPTDKDPYLYDNYNVFLSTSSVVTSNYQFLLARVISNGSITTIIDQRSNNIFSIINSSGVSSSTTLSQTNPLIGVEAIKFGSTIHPKHQNLVIIGFGFRSGSGQWVPTPSLFKITLNVGNGGTYTSTSDINNSDFDGWRVYFGNNKKYVNVVTTTVISPGVVELLLDDYNTLIHPVTGSITIVPAADHIDVFAENSDGNSNKSKIWELADGTIEIYMGVGLNYVSWAACLGADYTLRQPIVNGTYLNELSFDDNGNQTSTTTSSAAAGFITLLVHPRNFRDIKPNLDTPNIYTTSFNGFSGGSVKTSAYNIINGEVVYTVDPNGNYYELPLPANNAIVRNIIVDTISITDSSFIFIKFISAFTGCTFAKKTTLGTPGFAWNPSSTLSDKVLIRENDVFMFLGKVDKFNANEWRIVACYSHERFMIDSLVRRILVLEDPSDFSKF